jgi:hypothetical protein
MNGLKQVEAFWEKVCFDPHYEPSGRFRTYRDLVFEGMLEVVQNICPVTRSILSDEEIKKLFWDFLLASPPQSPVLRNLPWEVSQFLRRQGHPLLEEYPWLGELMEYEFLEIEVRFAEEGTGVVPPGAVALNPAHALGEYTWPVHFIDAKNHDVRVLPRGEFYLFLWRDPQSLEVKFMELNNLVAALIRQLKQGPMNIENLLEQTAKEVGIPLSGEYFQEGQSLIVDFLTQGILNRA